MNTPDAPARLIIPVELPEPPVVEPPPVETPSPTPAPPRRDPVATARPTEKPAPPPVEAPPVVLSTTPDTSAAERQIQLLIGAAQQSLSKVSYRELNANARVQYDLAQSYIRQTGDALKAKNYKFAESLARRAESVARLLVRG
jgi:hypothetical protein